jgi:hypothetical protein
MESEAKLQGFVLSLFFTRTGRRRAGAGYRPAKAGFHFV